MPIYSKIAVILCLAAPAFSATDTDLRSGAATPADEMKHIASLGSWVAALQDFKLLPTNVQKEMAAAADGQPFPEVRYINAGLAIRQADGRQLKIVLGKNGKIFFNGRLWKLDPLSRPAVAVEQIANQFGLSSESASLLGSFLPSAEAAMISSGAVLAYSSSASWKAKSCANDSEYSKDEAHDCALMGVSYNMPEPYQLKQELFQTGLVCPKKPGAGDLVLQSITTSDWSLAKIVITYENNVAKRVKYFSADKGKPLEMKRDITMDTDNDPGRQRFAKGLISLADPENNGVCQGPKESKDYFFKKLASNRATYRPPQEGAEAAPTSMQ